MQFKSPLVAATFLQRRKRFLADMRLETGEEVTAHCANSGSMLGLNRPGLKAWLSKSDDPKRKLAWSWELIEDGDAMIGINTSHPNGLVAEAIAAGIIPSLAGYRDLRREVAYGERSRVDILLTDPKRVDCYVEVKNAHLMRRPGLAEFPDSVTARGTRHLGELSSMVRQGKRAVMVYLIQRDDCDSLALARDIDPAYGAAFDRARAAGVEVEVVVCRLTLAGISAVAPGRFVG